MVSFELAGIQVGGGDVLGVLSRERARQGGENETGWLLVLRRARVGELRLCSERSMATARWQPRSSTGRRGKGRRGPVRRGVGPGGHRGAACGGGAAGGGLRPSTSAAAPLCSDGR